MDNREPTKPQTLKASSTSGSAASTASTTASTKSAQRKSLDSTHKPKKAANESDTAEAVKPQPSIKTDVGRAAPGGALEPANETAKDAVPASSDRSQQDQLSAVGLGGIDPPRQRLPATDQDATQAKMKAELDALCENMKHQTGVIKEYMDGQAKTDLKIKGLQKQLGELQAEKQVLEVKARNSEIRAKALEEERDSLVSTVEYLKSLVLDYNASNAASDATIREWESRYSVLTAVVGELGGVLSSMTTQLIQSNGILERVA